ncbi:PhoX family phosphatase [Aestuariivirga sp.]|uniref:PhoX family protein n=1 Tax=Aestuariivirga sp. TaxID=2650926 RepID=UPI0025C5687D|nr:PhoX family phosphatase [Aestuariivirga sp.]MCA3554657.1 PhoX family phosphatase [Aestuariivirga sp.]
MSSFVGSALEQATLSRRNLLKAGVGAMALAAASPLALLPRPARAAPVSSLTFTELPRIYDHTHHVADGYKADVVLRWGDKVAADAPAFDPATQTADSQSKQAGYNNDHMAYFPLPMGSQSSEHGILAINNEYPDFQIMFPGLITSEDDAGKAVSKDQADIGLASVGLTIVEVEKKDGVWRVVEGSPLARRITGFTEFAISGPAAGHDLMKTSADPTGTKVIGTSTNCAGGHTPWGTVLSCEEWSASFFGGDPAKTQTREALERIGMASEDYYGLARFYDRFNVEKEPNELNRFQWVVEVDPYDASAVPVKRTALGRFGHEGAAVALNKDGRAVVYMGDDDYFEYLYRFVSRNAFNAADRAANLKLLDEGVLSVAKLNADGTLVWMPLVQGTGPLTAENGFPDQATVLINARAAADRLGATKMDRPEDMEVSPVTGRVYAVMTKNKKRKPEQVDAANPRAANLWGQIVELIPPGSGAEIDHAAENFAWSLLVLAGDASKPEIKASFHPETTANGWFATPDNIAMDPKGRLWIATDGQNDFGIADGVFAMDVEGPGRGLSRALFACPTGAEATGPFFTPDGKTLFLSVQHPGEDSENVSKLSTTWPDFAPNGLPRPSVVAITRIDGGEIGG